ncbi:MAG TPA: CHAT domain-containing protein, partial [Nostocaceae cyanobacterium]|nr:CHAT domain-containing protein [Nostocaceae cyanobacterium]
GVALGNLGKYEEAILSFNKALQINSDYYQAWKNQGIALNNLRKYEEAILSYDKALQIKPDYYQAWINRGITAGNSISCDSFLSLSSSLAKNNPQLNKRGYKGRLTSYEEGLKYCQKSTHPEGWGRLHQYIGNAHYYQAKSDSYPHAYWRKAVTSYNEALTTLTALDFPELHLEVLQDLILVFLSLGETSKAEEIQRQGTDVLRILLDKCESPTKKQQLNYKFAAFQQITVDIAVQSGNWCAALELAEKGKNTCLSWLYEDWSGSPKLAEIKKLLNPNSAIIYWHLSNYALHTFILKYNAEPIIINSSVSPVKRLDDFEKWVKNWNEQYSNFRKGEKQEDKKLNTSWGDNLPSMLQQLGKILDISTIVNIINDKPCRDVTCNVSTNMEENSKIQNLILIPHRDLHRFPIHALFPDDFTITYLPSAQVGISLKLLHPNSINQIDQLPLLSVGYPDSKGFDILPQAEIESAAINQLFNHPESKCISGQAATNKELKAALPQNYNIFHFTGHSTYNFYNPKYSKLVLSGEESLTLAEILQIENLKQYKLVCLSACETAITSNQTITAEYVGLVSAFLSQGVANVVSTLWTVTDESSAFFMIYFYWQLKKGHSPAIALKKAQKWLRNLTFSKLERIYRVIFAKLSVDEKPLRPFIRKRLYQIEQMELAQKQTKPFAAPYYWAGFIITGGQN